MAARANVKNEIGADLGTLVKKIKSRVWTFLELEDLSNLWNVFGFLELQPFPSEQDISLFFN